MVLVAVVELHLVIQVSQVKARVAMEDLA